ncbi:unnamed protein product [Strongylus vulgaris]|uniref:Uncharacterized protein n=1 Tax=Strongylus vulgaris TaxID=40348 RepID=A0A3P7J1N2_STRVU|nr:unnamed protein product [Strongylus vulgaris]
MGLPTNLYLVTKCNCHINLEKCGTISAVKYLYKCIYKGPDRARIVLETETGDVVDKIKQHLNTRYVCPPQAVHRVFGFLMQDKSHTVCRLDVHLPEHQTVRFVAGEEQQFLNRALRLQHTLS